MSHTVSVTRTMTTSTSTAIIINTGILKTAPGLLKFFETIIGAVCLGLIAYYNEAQRGFAAGPEQSLFFIVSFAFLVTTFLMLLSGLLSLMAASILPKTIFEFLYHLLAFIFYLSASLSFMVLVSNQKSYYRTSSYEGKMAAAILGLINTVLYFLSMIFSFRSYRAG